MDPVAYGLVALAAATMRNGSTATLDAVGYTILFWAFSAAAIVSLLTG